MGDTKKVSHTGRFGPRYGRGIRKRVLKIEVQQRKKTECPFCEKPKIHRKAAGLFECRGCHTQFAGGAYTPTTMTGRIVNRTIRQKRFAVLESELETAKKEPVVKAQPKTKTSAKPKVRASKAAVEAAPEELLPEEK